MPEFLLGVSLMVALITCVTLYGQRENLARENSELLLSIERLQSEMRAASAARWIGSSTGDVDLDRLVGGLDSDSSKEV